MNVYEFDIWNQVKHNGKFSHTVIRRQVVHALNEERARRKITLEPSKSWNGGNGTLNTETGGEFIYGVRRTSSVAKQMYYVYSDGRSPRPVD